MINAFGLCYETHAVGVKASGTRGTGGSSGYTNSLPGTPISNNESNPLAYSDMGTIGDLECTSDSPWELTE